MTENTEQIKNEEAIFIRKVPVVICKNDDEE